MPIFWMLPKSELSGSAEETPQILRFSFIGQCQIFIRKHGVHKNLVVQPFGKWLMIKIQRSTRARGLPPWGRRSQTTTALTSATCRVPSAGSGLRCGLWTHVQRLTLTFNIFQETFKFSCSCQACEEEWPTYQRISSDRPSEKVSPRCSARSLTWPALCRCRTSWWSSRWPRRKSEPRLLKPRLDAV